MDTLLDSQENTQRVFAVTKKNAGENLPLLSPKQIKVGSKTVMPYKERLLWLKNSRLGELYGFKQNPQPTSNSQ